MEYLSHQSGNLIYTIIHGTMISTTLRTRELKIKDEKTITADTNARSNTQFQSTCAHMFLSYHLINVDNAQEGFPTLM